MHIRLLINYLSLIALIPLHQLQDFDALSDVLGLLAILICQGEIDVVHQQHLADLKVITLGCQVQATAAHRVVVVDVSALVLEQHVHEARMAVPTSYFEGRPFLATQDVGVH